MKTKRIAAVVMAAWLTVVASYGQTAAEQMQKGIYTQETAGDLDGAIAIYRQIVSSGSSPRDMAAQAQYRLAQSLLQKGDLSNAAQEFEKLARNYADYGKLVSSMASMARTNTAYGLTTGGAGAGRGGGEGGGTPAASANLTSEHELADMEKRLLALRANRETASLASMSFDSTSPVTVKGVMFRTDIMNPAGAIFVDPKDGTGKRFAFVTAGPAELRNQGWTRDALRMGDEVTVTGSLATGGQTLPDGAVAASANTVTRADGRKLFDRSAIPK